MFQNEIRLFELIVCYDGAGTDMEPAVKTLFNLTDRMFSHFPTEREGRGILLKRNLFLGNTVWDYRGRFPKTATDAILILSGAAGRFYCEE